jgi:hypothetical protein
MGREARRVPAAWKHPRDAVGRFIPLSDHFNRDVVRWDEEARHWNEGFYRLGKDGEWTPRGPEEPGTFEEWNGPRPRRDEYMPDWPEPERTHYQMYENTTEGTPISPVMTSPQALAHWLADRASAASYEEWLGMIEGTGAAPDAVFSAHGTAVTFAARRPRA